MAKQKMAKARREAMLTQIRARAQARPPETTGAEGLGELPAKATEAAAAPQMKPEPPAPAAVKPEPLTAAERKQMDEIELRAEGTSDYPQPREMVILAGFRARVKADR